ncbi:MAG: hypothetical protein NVSMB48_00370 [Marmoricola sp.]
MSDRVVYLEDLRRACRERAPSTMSVPTEPTGHNIAGPIVAVLGASGGCGATTLALAIAEHLHSARILECRTTPVSTLVAATTYELGTLDSGWQMGTRDSSVPGRGAVSIHRAPQALTSPALVPRPEEGGAGTATTVIDVGWRIGELEGWLARAVDEATAIVVPAIATCPGLTNLEATLSELEDRTTAPITIAVRGPHLKRWPTSLKATTGPRTRKRLEIGDVLTVEEDRTLHLLGLTTDRLPRAVVAAGEVVVGHLQQPFLANPDDEHQRHQILTLERTPS